MIVKSLLSKMGRKRIEDVCKEKGWRLPTLEEAINNIDDIEHKSFWIEGYANSPDPDTGKNELRPLFFSNGVANTLSPNFMINLVVIKKEKKCPSCGTNCNG